MKNKSKQKDYSERSGKSWKRILHFITCTFGFLRKKQDSEPTKINRYYPKGDKKGINGRTSLGKEEMEIYCQKVITYLKTSEVYKEPNLSVAYVAKATGISSILISQSINTLLGKNFFNLINGMRVEEVKRMLLNGYQNKYSIEQIACTCGFRSRSSFYLAFNKIEGIPPTEWLKKNKKSRDDEQRR